MDTQVDVSIVAVPFPAHGHLNQILHFSLLLSSHGLPVHFACSATHNGQARTRVQGWHPNSVDNIRFHDLPLPPFHVPNPNPDADIGFPAHIQPMFDASDHLRAPIAELLRSLAITCRRLVVIYDPLMTFAGIDAASTLSNAETYCFSCISAFFLLSFFHGENLHKMTEQPKNLDLILKPFADILTEEFKQFVERRWIDNPFGSGMVINTNRALDGEFLELLCRQPTNSGKKVFAIGPVNPLAPAMTEGGCRHECLQWLDKQPPASVLYISFGTTSTISDEQIEELAVRLRRSGQRFIWVLRDADRGDIFADGKECQRRNLPPGFEGGGFGVVVREFAPQLEILAHQSTGGFMSHCGWNSCMESLSMGVPILAWPMHSDQPKNASMVTEYLKVGVTIRNWNSRKGVVPSAIIEESIRRVFVDEGGEEIRKRAQSLGEAVRASVADGGTSKNDLDSFISHITRVSSKNAWFRFYYYLYQLICTVEWLVIKYVFSAFILAHSSKVY